MNRLRFLLLMGTMLLMMVFAGVESRVVQAGSCTNSLDFVSLVVFSDEARFSYTVSGTSAGTQTYTFRALEWDPALLAFVDVLGTTSATVDYPGGGDSTIGFSQSLAPGTRVQIDASSAACSDLIEGQVIASSAPGPGEATPQCPDGRINFNHCDKVAIYATQDGDAYGVGVYVVDGVTVPVFALFVSAEALAALPPNPESVIQIAQSDDGKVTLYKHTNGDYQVNYGPDFEGKVFTFRWSGLPATGYPEFSTFTVTALHLDRARWMVS
jgi:hypothetical protein